MVAAPRDTALDALRGLAILGMVLSGSLGFGPALPGWMFHAQVPPPLHKFVPTLPGISWVDLVFPFFLFSLGAALPLAMQRVGSGFQVLKLSARRFALLLFFALFTQHMKAWVIAVVPDWQAQLLSIGGFVLLGLLLTARTPGLLKGAAWAAALALLALLPFQNGAGFDWGRSDIILVVLANMALFGGLQWGATRTRPLLRLALLPLLAAVLLARGLPADAGFSATAWLLHATPAAWAYQFFYLKYLFIVVPGMFAGEWLLRQRALPTAAVTPGLAAAALALIVLNVALLYRHDALALQVNLGLSLLLCAAMAWWARRSRADALTQRCVQAGGYLLALGLALEALEGGIRKDSSTFSYYFVSSGLAFFALLALRGCAPGLRDYLAVHGRNPLLAYVAGSLLLLPLLHLTGLYPLWAGLTDNAGQALLRGLLFTAAVSALTLICTHRGWVWKS